MTTDWASKQSMEEALNDDSLMQNKLESERDVKNVISVETNSLLTPEAPQLQQNEVIENDNEIPPESLTSISNSIPQAQIESISTKFLNNRNRPVRYKGSVRESLPCGSGVLMFEDGSFYDGSFENGKPHGFGRYVSIGGDIVAGYFEKGRCRKGLRVSASGHTYTGEYHSTQGSGIFEGSGQIRFINGDVYEGHFRLGRFHGTGKYSFHDGTTVYCSTWENDEPRGMVSITASDRSYFTGHILRSQQLLEGRAFVRFEDGGWLETQSSDESNKLDMDSRSGCTIFDASTLTKRWRYGFTKHYEEKRVPNGDLLVCLSSLPLISFSPEVPADSNQIVLERTILAVHQHLQFALKSIAKDDQVKWVINDSCDLVAIQSLLNGTYKRALAITRKQCSADDTSIKDAFTQKNPDRRGFYHLRIGRREDTPDSLLLWSDGGHVWNETIVKEKFEAIPPQVILLSLEGEWYNVENSNSEIVQKILTSIQCPVLVRITLPDMHGADHASRRFVKFCCNWAVNMLS